MRAIVPLANLTGRLPEAGRLRTGVQAPTRSGKTAPKSIPTWRATSHDERAIRELAEIYGGTPEPWTDAPTPGQWEVITESAELNVVLPPDPLGGTPLYELWSGGGCRRRCDGVVCQTPIQGPDGTEQSEVPCMCSAAGKMLCTPHTRLSVILPDVRFGGTWRYESATSWNVMQELPGMVGLIQSLQGHGLTRALLAIEQRKSAQTKKPFTVPVLRVAQSLEAIASGRAQVATIDAAPRLVELEAPVQDDEVVDAVVVDRDDPEESAPEEMATAEEVAAWVRLFERLPAVLGDEGVAEFRKWGADQGFTAQSRTNPTVKEWESLVGKVREMYQAKYPPRTWDPAELDSIRDGMIAMSRDDSLRRDWEVLQAFVFDEFAELEPSTWTQGHYDRFVPYLMGPASSNGAANVSAHA